MWKILVILLCLTALILLVVMICDSNRFVKVSYRISDRRLKKNCRVVLLADLHNKSYGKHNEKLLAAIKSSNPDLILCAGDLITSRSGKSMEHAKELLRTTDLTSAQIAERVGFLDPNYFSVVFKKTCGMTPREYRNK